MNSVFTYSKFRHVDLPDGKMQFCVLSMLFINSWSIVKHFHTVVMYILFKVCFCGKLGNFLSKKCKVSFLFSIDRFSRYSTKNLIDKLRTIMLYHMTSLLFSG